MLKLQSKDIKEIRHGGDWDLVFEGKVYETVKAKELYNMLVENAFYHNEPGVFFIDRVEKDNNAHWAFKLDRTNPCGEICVTGDTVVWEETRGPMQIKDLLVPFYEATPLKVLSYNIETGVPEYKRVLSARLTKKNASTLTLHVEDSQGTDKTLTCTPDHLIYTSNRGYVKAEEIQVEDYLIMSDGTSSYPAKLRSIEPGGNHNVFDISVSENFNFFANNLLIHNCMPAYSLCCLGSINLSLFVKDAFEETASFDYDALYSTINLAIRFLDNVLDATQYPLEKIEEFSKQWRRVGLGFTGLGDALAMMRIPYGSKESKKFAYEFSQAMMVESYKASALLAKEKGMAPGLQTKGFLKNKVNQNLFASGFIRKLPLDIVSLIDQYGLRNIGLLTCAPTGTISFSVGNNCSSGIEPIFSLYYDRNIRTGKGDETKKETVYDYAYLKYLDWVKTKPDLDPGHWDTTAKKWFATTFDVKPEDAIEIQGIIQEHVDHSISKTLNFDGKALGLAGYKHLFEYAYDRGLKGFTSFNTTSGSMKGILEAPAEKSKPAEKPDNYVVRSDAPPRPKQLPCDIHYVHANNEDFIVLVGKLNGSLYEIFVDIKNGHDFKGATEGLIVKRAKGEYALESADGLTFLDSLSKDFNGTYGVLARMLSMSLRHGVPLQFIIDQLQRSKEFLGFEKAVARVLKKYIKEGEVLEMKCPSCGGKMVYRDSCPTCQDCGYGKCS